MLRPLPAAGSSAASQHRGGRPAECPAPAACPAHRPAPHLATTAGGPANRPGPHLAAIDGGPAAAGASGVAPLDHEVPDDAVELQGGESGGCGVWGSPPPWIMKPRMMRWNCSAGSRWVGLEVWWAWGEGWDQGRLAIWPAGGLRPRARRRLAPARTGQPNSAWAAVCPLFLLSPPPPPPQKDVFSLFRRPFHSPCLAVTPPPHDRAVAEVPCTLSTSLPFTPPPHTHTHSLSCHHSSPSC